MKVLLCLAHMSGNEMKYIDEAFADNWVVPLGPMSTDSRKTSRSILPRVTPKPPPSALPLSAPAPRPSISPSFCSA